MPSSAMVRQALDARGFSRAVIRAAVAVASALAEEDVSGGRGITAQSGGVAELAERTGLVAAEVRASLSALREAGVLEIRGDALRLDADLYCTLPALAEIDWPGVRTSVGRSGGRQAPALGLLRELARMSRRGADGAGEWLQPTVQELVEETLYGRTAITQALGDLTAAGLIVRADQPARNGLRLQLAATAFGGQAAGRPPAAADSLRVGSASKGAGTGVLIEIGGATIGVPAGSRMELPAGTNYKLEIAPDGRAIIRIDD